MSRQCRGCQDGWEHCHGMLIIHAQRRAECTEDDCPAPEHMSHPLVVDCDAVGCACGRSAAIAI